MIKSLFDSELWDVSSGYNVLYYFDCTLKVPIGDYKIGAKIPCISVDQEKGILEIGLETFKLTLKVE